MSTTNFARENEMRPLVAAWLIGQGYLVKREYWQPLPVGPIDLLGFKVAPRHEALRQTYREVLKANTTIAAVELKLHNIKEVLLQAARRFELGVDQSYVALPLPRAHQLLDQAAKWQPFFELGVGVLGIDAGVSVLRPSELKRGLLSGRYRSRIRIVHQFWRTFRRQPYRLENFGGHLKGAPIAEEGAQP